MELQEGDGLMAGSRHRANWMHHAFCGMRGNAQTQTIHAGSRQILADKVTPHRPTANKDQPMKRPPFQFPRAM
jgi:hypothetical protein